MYAELTQWKSVRSKDKKPYDNILNARIVGFSSNRQATITLQDAIFDNNALAMLTGNDLATGAKNVTRNEIVTVTSNAGTLAKTPVGNPLGVFKQNADGSLGMELTKTSSTLATGQYSLTGKNLTFFAGDIANAGKVVVYYTVATDATAKTVRVSSDKFGQTFKVVIDVLVRDEYTKEDFQGQIIIPNAKFQDNFDLSLI